MAKSKSPQKINQETILEMLDTNGGIQIAGNDNIVAQFIVNIYKSAGLDSAIKVKSALDTYINTILTDKNRVPLEFILAREEKIRYEVVPLPAVFTELDVVYSLPLSHENLNEKDKEYARDGKEVITENKPTAAVQAVAQNKHIVIVGDPGAGKTTLINYLCVIMALMHQGDRDAEERLKHDSNETWKANEILFPISIRLRDFGRSDIFRDGEANASTLADYIVDKVVAEHKKIDVDASIQGHVLELLKRGGALIVMDGLDELPGEVYETVSTGQPEEVDNRQYYRKTATARMKLQRILNRFTKHPEYGKCRVVVTSRSYAYRTNAEWRLDPHFAEAHLRDFEPKQIQEYIRYWYIQIAKRRAQQNLIDRNIVEPVVDDEKIQKTVNSFWEALENNEHMLELARSPLILTFIVGRYGNDEHVPTVSKVNLYAQIVTMLTNFWSRHQLESDDLNGTTTLIDALGLHEDSQLELLLSAVAFEAHKGMEDYNDANSAIITIDTLKHGWEKIGKLIKVGNVPQEVWIQLRDRTGILLPYRTDDNGIEYFAFTHTSFQEWLAAIAIMSESRYILPVDYWSEDYRQDPDDLKVPDLVAGLIQIARERWQEVIALILESTFYSKKPGAIWPIIDRLVSEPIPKVPEDNRWFGALLAGGFLERNKDTINDTDRAEPVAVRRWLVRSLQRQAMSIEDRVEAGRILSILSDDRVQFPFPSFNETVWLPDYAHMHPDDEDPIDNLWVCVPETTVLLGSPPRDVEARHRSEERRPADCERRIQGFYISRYQVTNEMFQKFVEHGYNRKDCWNWSSSSLQWHESYPTPEQSNQMLLQNAPCRTVSWYEAVAFCRWLTLVNPFNLEVFLPSESEWLAAACSDRDGKFHDTVYVWGDSVEEEPAKLEYYGNVRRLKLNAVCSVGVFKPNKLGIFDMSGNVAEWTRSIWRPNLAGLEKNELDRRHRNGRTVRGCSYRAGDADIRVGRRRGMLTEKRYPFIGFRIAARIRNS